MWRVVTNDEDVPFRYFFAVAADTAVYSFGCGVFFSVDFEFPAFNGDGVSGGCGYTFDKGGFGAALCPGVWCFADNDVIFFWCVVVFGECDSVFVFEGWFH